MYHCPIEFSFDKFLQTSADQSLGEYLKFYQNQLIFLRSEISNALQQVQKQIQEALDNETSFISSSHSILQYNEAQMHVTIAIISSIQLILSSHSQDKLIFNEALESNFEYFSSTWCKEKFSSEEEITSLFTSYEPQVEKCILLFCIGCIYRERNIETAISYFTRIIDSMSTTHSQLFCCKNLLALCYHEIGFIYRSQNNNQAALEKYAMAIELDPNFHVFYLNRSVANACDKQYEKAIHDLTVALALPISDAIQKADLYHGRFSIQAFLLRNNFQSALNDLNTALSLNYCTKYLIEKLNLYLTCLYDAKNALKFAQKAIDLAKQTNSNLYVRDASVMKRKLFKEHFDENYLLHNASKRLLIFEFNCSLDYLQYCNDFDTVFELAQRYM